MSKPICIRSERFARSAGLLASLVNRPGRYSRLFWRVYRNEAGLLDTPSSKPVGRQTYRPAGLLDKSLPNWRNILRMITWLIDEGDKPAIYAPSELPNSRWEVHIRPQDLCVFALTTYVALLICWVIRVPTVCELSYNAQTQRYSYCGSLLTYATTCRRTAAFLDDVPNDMSTKRSAQTASFSAQPKA